jgi:hypothetical protein
MTIYIPPEVMHQRYVEWVEGTHSEPCSETFYGGIGYPEHCLVPIGLLAYVRLDEDGQIVASRSLNRWRKRA